ncbi:MAG: hypothetical protein ACOYD4_08560 [Solirubrobacterales bacterium]
MRLRLILLLAALAVLLTFVPMAGAACIKRHSVRIATGASPNGLPWTVNGTIGNNGDRCGEWLFGMEFELTGATSWGWSTGIPAGGHLRRGFDIDASDNLQEDGVSRVFSGTVDGEVAKVLATLSNNKHLTVRPKAPSAKLRRNVVWLRNVRYFVQYYPPVAFVTGVSLFSARGQLLYRNKNFEGF